MRGTQVTLRGSITALLALVVVPFAAGEAARPKPETGAKPAAASGGPTKATPNKNGSKKPSAPQSDHCRGPWLDRGAGGLCAPSPDPSDAGRAKVNTLEDVYGVPSGENFQAAIGFRVREGDSNAGAAASSFGVAVDDMVVEWREYKLGTNATDCLAGGLSGTVQCATVEVDSDRVYQGNSVITITVTDPSPYRCLGGPPCVPENRNDCDHNGSFADPGDDNDCDDDGTPDVLVRAFTPLAEPAGEWVVLNQVGTTQSYRGTLPISIGGNVAGVLYVTDLGGLNNDITVRYTDDWDGSAEGNRCANNPDPAKQGFVDRGVNLVITDKANVVVTAFRIDDSIAQASGGSTDSDGYPDTDELVNLYVTVSNKSHQKLTHLVVQASVNDPKIECLLSSVSTLASLNADVTTELPVPFQFKVSALADRGGLVPLATCTGGVCSNGAGACTVVTDCQKTPISDYSALFLITLSADQFDINTTPQQIALDLDLNSANPSIATSTFTEGFEGGFGNFQFLNLDFNIAANSLSNGMRCQYNDPDFINSNSYGDTQCYLGFVAGQSPLNDWHVHTTASPDLGRAYLGTQSLHYGKHTPGTPTLDTYGLSQMDAVRTKSNINLAARICQNDPSANKKSCTTAADCVSVGGGPCVSASPLFSFKHQVSTADNRGTNTPAGQAVDRAVVHAQLNTSAVWQKLFPYQNVYDAQGTDNFSNCLFDPTDDGNTEDSYFDPTDPQRRLGPSSTCFPEFAFSYLGNTDKPFQAVNTGRASDGPGLRGSLGPGVWVESRFDLSRYRGRAIKLRYLFTTIKAADIQTEESLFKWNPTPEDDGWYIDDIRVTQTLGASSPTVTNDITNNGNASCGAICNSFQSGPALTASPPSIPAPGVAVTLTAAATVDRCANGALLYQFWWDVNQNGVIEPGGTPTTCVSVGPSPATDCLLRDFSTNPILADAPTGSTGYIVRVRCSTAAIGVCDATAAATVAGPGTATSLESDETTPPANPAQARTGSSLSAAGDLNGDGIQDFITGAPGYQAGGAGAGAAVVYLGSTVDTERTSPDIVFTGAAAGDRAGISVAGNFDWDGDGIPDLLIGADNAGSGAGAVYLVLFKPGDYPNLGNPAVPDVVSLANVGGSIHGLVFNGQTGDQAGFSVVGGARLDAGTTPDIAIGAPGASPLAEAASAGRVYAIFNDNSISASSVPLSSVGTAGAHGIVYRGEGAGDRLGHAVVFPGNVVGIAPDPPGDDLAMSAPWANTVTSRGGSQSQAGKVYVVQGGSLTNTPGEVSAGNVACTLYPSPCSPAVEIKGEQFLGDTANEHFGFSLGGGCDNQVDGNVDLLIGSPNYAVPGSGTEVLSNAGRVLQSSTTLGKGIIEVSSVGFNPDAATVPGAIWNGAAAGDQLGYSLACAGDVTGDGLPEIALGAPFAVGGTGRVYVINAAVTPPHRGTISVSTVGSLTPGSQPNEHAGFSLAGISDIAASGRNFIAVGAPERQVGSDASAGVVYLFHQGPSSLCTSVGFPWRKLLAQDKTTFKWGPPEQPAVGGGCTEVIRGDLNALRANGGNFNSTVLACVSNDITGAEAVDSANPVRGSPWYYLARQSVAPPSCTLNTTWSPHPTSPQEQPGAGGNRDADLAGAPNVCPGSPP